jgi:acetyl esterase
MLDKQMYERGVVIRIFGMMILSMILPSSAISQQATPPAYPPTMPDAQVETYKTVGDVDMRVWIFTPEGHSTDDYRPAIVFFFGGGWSGGNPVHFRRHCEYLAARGMVAIAADYRVRSRHGVTANRCVEDAKSAMRWIRMHADRLGIDPNRIAAGGGSSGGHLAAATATLPLYDDPNDDLSISARPNALVLFNPAVVLAPISEGFEFLGAGITNLNELMGVELESISPYHHVKSGVVPTIIFHGTADNIVPYKTVELFREKMKAQGNPCLLVGYQGAGHGFFNYGRNNNAPFIDTVNKMDAFLVSLGYLKGAPETIHNK